ncbi:AAA ATPase-like protein [Aureococcus anophagefferens]|nr:AAA ATPase-like protein [Aureococcus anophagefferens]
MDTADQTALRAAWQDLSKPLNASAALAAPLERARLARFGVAAGQFAVATACAEPLRLSEVGAVPSVGRLPPSVVRKAPAPAPAAAAQRRPRPPRRRARRRPGARRPGGARSMGSMMGAAPEAEPRGRPRSRWGDDDRDDEAYERRPYEAVEENRPRGAFRGAGGGGPPKRQFQVPRANNGDGKAAPGGKKMRRGASPGGGQAQQRAPPAEEKKPEGEDELPERLKGCDPELVKRIEREIMHSGAITTFDDVAGLQDAKRSIMEMVIWPMQRPELFTGLRAVPKGMLLFGPPGTGKTLIGRAIASSSGATFFSISASSLMSKWIGESEKLVRTMFAVAGHKEPSVVFIDEVDSLLSQRSSDENEASRRLKTEFLVQLEGVGSGDASNRERVLVVGATNRPQELDEAARRRFVKRFYVPLPDDAARRSLLGTLLKHNRHSLSPAELDGDVVDRTRGFSGADIRNLCQEAAMGPMRDVGSSLFAGGGAPGVLSEDQIPPISFAHFDNALKITRATVAPEDLVGYEAWDAQFGSARAS